MTELLLYAIRLLLIAVNTAFTTKFFRHACCHVALASGPTLVNAHALAGFLIDVRGP